MTDERHRASVLKALLVAEILVLLIASLVVHYSGIPFTLSDQEGVWCIDHGGLPGGISNEEVRVDHTLWPLGITCRSGTTSIAYPDWPTTFWEYGLVAAILAITVVTVVLLVRTRRRIGQRAARDAAGTPSNVSG